MNTGYGLTGLTGFTCLLLRLWRTLSKLDPLPLETMTSVRRTVRIGAFLPERHQNLGNPVNPV